MGLHREVLARMESHVEKKVGNALKSSFMVCSLYRLS